MFKSSIFNSLTYEQTMKSTTPVRLRLSYSHTHIQDTSFSVFSLVRVIPKKHIVSFFLSFLFFLACVTYHFVLPSSNFVFLRLGFLRQNDSAAAILVGRLGQRHHRWNAAHRGDAAAPHRGDHRGHTRRMGTEQPTGWRGGIFGAWSTLTLGKSGNFGWEVGEAEDVGLKTCSFFFGEVGFQMVQSVWTNKLLI